MLSAGDRTRRRQRWQVIAKVEGGRLGVAGTVLPRMDVLGRTNSNEGSSISVHFRVLDGDERSAGGSDAPEGISVGEEVLPSFWVSVEPHDSRIGEVCARRVTDDKVPA